MKSAKTPRTQRPNLPQNDARSRNQRHKRQRPSQARFENPLRPMTRGAHHQPGGDGGQDRIDEKDFKQGDGCAG